MDYHYSKIVDGAFDDVVAATIESMKAEGFGVLTDIDVTATLKKKLGVDFRKYRIIGACNPNYAYQALRMEDKIGTMLPCNIIVQETDDGKVEVSTVNPVASMKAVDNPDLMEVAGKVQKLLRNVIDGI